MEYMFPSPGRLDDEKQGLNHSHITDIGIGKDLQYIFFGLVDFVWNRTTFV